MVSCFLQNIFMLHLSLTGCSTKLIKLGGKQIGHRVTYSAENANTRNLCSVLNGLFFH